jgi:hypothetical protein
MQLALLLVMHHLCYLCTTDTSPYAPGSIIPSPTTLTSVTLDTIVFPTSVDANASSPMYSRLHFRYNECSQYPAPCASLDSIYLPICSESNVAHDI